MAKNTNTQTIVDQIKALRAERKTRKSEFTKALTDEYTKYRKFTKDNTSKIKALQVKLADAKKAEKDERAKAKAEKLAARKVEADKKAKAKAEKAEARKLEAEKNAKVKAEKKAAREAAKVAKAAEVQKKADAKAAKASAKKVTVKSAK